MAPRTPPRRCVEDETVYHRPPPPPPPPALVSTDDDHRVAGVTHTLFAAYGQRTQQLEAQLTQLTQQLETSDARLKASNTDNDRYADLLECVHAGVQ